MKKFNINSLKDFALNMVDIIVDILLWIWIVIWLGILMPMAMVLEILLIPLFQVVYLIRDKKLLSPNEYVRCFWSSVSVTSEYVLDTIDE